MAHNVRERGREGERERGREGERERGREGEREIRYPSQKPELESRHVPKPLVSGQPSQPQSENIRA
jgi:hypothetical protein